MVTKDYNLIAMSIWRSGFIKDKNKIRQEARENMRKLITNDIIGSLKQKPNFNENEFLKNCGYEKLQLHIHCRKGSGNAMNLLTN